MRSVYMMRNDFMLVFTPAVGGACPSSVVLKGKENKVLPTKSQGKDTFPIIHLYFHLRHYCVYSIDRGMDGPLYKMHTAKQSRKTKLA